MKCLVINLDRSRDRLAHIASEFDRIGISFERIAAIDASERPDLSEISGRARSKFPLRLTNAEIACLLSHKTCWSIIAASDDAHGAVFEDDVMFSENAGPLLADASWIPADADIVKIETFFERTVVARRRIPVGHGFSLSRLHGTHMGSAGYIISRRAARALADTAEDVGIPVDQMMFNPTYEMSSDRVIYQLLPALCLQEQSLRQGQVRLPSLINADRRERRAASGADKKPTKPVLTRIWLEILRISRQAANFCRLRQLMVVPFEYRGKRVREPHTQRRENAL